MSRLLSLLLLSLFGLYACVEQEEEMITLQDPATSVAELAVDSIQIPAYNENKVAYYAFDATTVGQPKPDLTEFTDKANIVVVFEGTLWELADSVHYGSPDTYILSINGGPYTYYSQILEDIQILRSRGIMVLMNVDDTPAWSTATPFTTWDGKSLNYEEYAAFIDSCVQVVGFDGISLDVEHQATDTEDYRALIKEFGKYFGPFSSRPTTSIYTGAFYEGGAPGPIFRELDLSQYMNFLMDMGYFNDDTWRFDYWANTLGNARVMNGYSHQLNSFDAAVAHATWHPDPDKAGIMVFAGNVNKQYTDGIFDALDGIVSCNPITLTPHLNIDNTGWQNTNTAIVNLGSSVLFGPGPNSGTWSWTGPDGFTANTREALVSNIGASQAGIYVATNTDACDEETVFEFEIVISGTCTPTTLTPHARVDNGSWQDTNAVSVSVGGTVWLGPGPNSGSWNWTGPNDYTASIREISISNIQTSQAGIYTVTNTNSCGAESTVSFTITLN